MYDRFLKGRAAQRLVAGLTPPFDREIIEAGLGEMSRDRFRLSCCALGIVAQELGGAPMQNSTAALQDTS